MITKAIETVARQLGNTVAICRKCYVHPVVMEAYSNGSLHAALKRALAAPASNANGGLRPEETAVLAFLRGAIAQSLPRAAA
jgi:DNA topoisomerase-1